MAASVRPHAWLVPAARGAIRRPWTATHRAFPLRTISTTPARQVKAKDTKVQRAMRGGARSIGASMSASIGKATAQAQDMPDMILPSTFVPPPFFSNISTPRDFFSLRWLLLKQRARDIFGLLVFKWASKPSLFKRPRFRLRNGAIAPTAKALHRAMSESLAAGDKDGLRRACGRSLFTRLAAAVDARPRGRRYGWDLVRYKGRPRVVDHKLGVLGGGNSSMPGLRQAVVGIASRQRLVEYDDSRGYGTAVGEKEVDLVEYLVLSAPVNMRTMEQGPWVIAGTMKETNLDEMRKDIAAMEMMEKEELQKHKVL